MKFSVESLERTFPGATEPTLRSVSFTLPAGTLTAVLGTSGAGKSTLLRSIMGLDPFERGTISLDNLQVQGTLDCSVTQRARQLRAIRPHLGLVFQSFELFPHLTALENCTLAPQTVRGLSVETANAQALQLLAELGLRKQAHQHPDALSGGQKQRVAIARALMMEPKLLLYDEPTSALDSAMKSEVVQTLRRVDARHVTQVVVTHDLQVARATEFICILHRGEIVESGPPAQVLSAPSHPHTKALLDAWH